jgi:hypothetical protein
MRSLFKSAIAAIASLGLAVASYAQAPILAKSVNYGNGTIVIESTGTGAPASSCLGLSKYTQTDATPGSNTWLCINGTMVQQVGVGAGCTSGSGTCTFASQVVAPSVQTGTPPSGNTVTIKPVSTVPTSWTFDMTTPKTALQTLLPGVQSDGSNGIKSTINKVINPTAAPYNAYCDGTHDDQSSSTNGGVGTGLQGALDDAYTLGYSVQLPAGKCKTSTLLYKCQVLRGAGKTQTILQGQPGQDVIRAATGSVLWSCTVPISDMTITVDASVDASSTTYGGGNNTFPDRLTGTAGGPSSAPIALPTADGGPISVGPVVSPSGATISLSTPTTLTLVGGGTGFRPDVVPSFLIIGQPITITGAGASGANLTTTVSAVVNSTTLTLAGAASTAVSNVGFTINSTIQSPIAVGNCGLAFPESAITSPNALALSGSTLVNILFNEVNAPGAQWGANHSCGLWLQSNNYNNHFDNIDFYRLWCGYCEAPPAVAPSAYSDRTADTTTYGTMNYWQDIFPMIMYNGANRTMDSAFIYGEFPWESGIFQLGASLGTSPSDPGSIDVKQLYWEATNLNMGETSRWKGSKNHFGTVETGYGNSTATYIGDLAEGKFFESVNPLSVIGNGNTFSGMFTNSSITDSGNDNDFICAGYGNHPIPRKWHCGPVAPRESVGRLTNSFIQTGNAANPFRNSDDLLFTCQDWINSIYPNNFAGSLCTADGTGSEITHSYLALTMTNAGPYNFYGVNTPNVLGVIGNRFPYTTLQMYSQGRCVGASTCAGSIEVRDIPLSGATNTVLATCAVTYTSAWTTQGPCSVNIASGTVGDTIAFRNNSFSNSPTEVDIAYIGFQVPATLPSGVALVSPAMSGTPTAPTATGGTNTTQVATTAFVQSAVAANTLLTNVPLPLQYFGDGNEGALNVTSGTTNIIPGSHYYTTCNVSSGATLAVVVGAFVPVGTPLFLHCKTSATIAGTVSYSNNTGSSTGINNGTALYGGGSGGGGFGAANGAAGSGYLTGVGGGTAGTSGVAGGNGTAAPGYVLQMLLDSIFPYSSTSGCGGPIGATGGSSGPAGGRGGGCIFITSPTLSFTGTLDVSGVNGGAGGSNTGGSGGGGGGVVILRSPSFTTNTGTFTLTGGTGGAAGTGTSTAGGNGATGSSKVYTQ